jgi:hypothetical protein
LHAACSTASSAAALATVDTSQQPRALAHISSGAGYSSSGNPLQQTALQAHMPAFQQLQQQLVGPDSWQLLFEGLHASPGITVTESQVDFGSCSRLSPCEARSFTVSNTTNTKLLVSLLVPPWQDPSGPPGKTAQVFQVSARLTIIHHDWVDFRASALSWCRSALWDCSGSTK